MNGEAQRSSLSGGAGRWAEREEAQLALTSGLQELTVAAFALFDPRYPVSEFLLRFAERMRWSATLCLEWDRDLPAFTLVGSAGLSGASRALAIPAPRAVEKGEAPWGSVALPYPELDSPELVRWVIPFSTEVPADARRALLIYYPSSRELSPAVRGTVRRVARVLQTAFIHRRVYARLVEETTLLESESEASSDGILVVSTDWRVLFHTRRFLETWGFTSLPEGSPAEPLFRSAAELVQDPERFLGWTSGWGSHPEGEGTLELPLRDRRVLELRSVPIRSAAGALVGRGWYFRDVTERKQAETARLLLLEQEREARAAAEEAVRERDRFLSVSAHELRTPVTRLRLRIDGLARRVELGRAPAPESMAKVRESLRKLTTLIDDLLDFSRLQTGSLPLHLQPCRIDPLVEEVVDSFRPVSPRHELLLEEEAHGVEVRGDLPRLEQVVSNLLENAIKYSPAGGTIRVTLARVGAEAVIAVSDPGIGIQEEERRRLFKRFFRGANAPLHHFAGLGLGLYISREIVERHGGRITVESVLGTGSTFRVFLPLLTQEAATAGGTEQPPAGPG